MTLSHTGPPVESTLTYNGHGSVSASAEVKQMLSTDLRPLLAAGNSAVKQPVDHPEAWGSVSIHWGQFLQSFVYRLLFPVSTACAYCAIGPAYVHNMSLLTPWVHRLRMHDRKMWLLFLTGNSIPVFHVLIMCVWGAARYNRPSELTSTESQWWNSMDYEIIVLNTMLALIRMGYALREATYSRADFAALLREYIPGPALGDELIGQGWVFLADRVIVKETHIAFTATGSSDQALYLHLSRPQYQALLSKLSPSALELLGSLVLETFDGGSSVGGAVARAVLLSTEEKHYGSRGDSSSVSAADIVVHELAEPKSGGAAPVGHIGPQAPVPNLSSLGPVRLPAGILCAVLLKHVHTEEYPRAFGPITRVITALAFLAGLVPVITRAAWGVSSSSFSYSVAATAITVLSCFCNMFNSYAIVCTLYAATFDMRRRLLSLQLLGEWITPTRESACMLRTESVPEQVSEIINLNSADNIRAWLQCRQVLLSVGRKYFIRLMIFVFVCALLTVVLGSAVLSQLLDPRVRTSREVLGELIAAVFILVQYFISFGVVILMLLSGAALNGLASAHASRILELQLKLGSSGAQHDHHLSVMLQLLGAASQTLLCREPLKLFGLPASYGFAQSVAYAAATALAVVARLLNDKYSWVTLGSST